MNSAVYGNNLAQQITSTFDVVLCGLALGVLAVAILAGRRRRRIVQPPPQARGDGRPPARPTRPPRIHRPAEDSTQQLPADRPKILSSALRLDPAPGSDRRRAASKTDSGRKFIATRVIDERRPVRRRAVIEDMAEVPAATTMDSTSVRVMPSEFVFTVITALPSDWSKASLAAVEFVATATDPVHNPRNRRHRGCSAVIERRGPAVWLLGACVAQDLILLRSP